MSLPSKLGNINPFGGRFGLSYTTFAYSSLIVGSPSADDTFSVSLSFQITNTGRITGSEAAQVYVVLPAGGPTTPKYQLRAFSKVKDVKPGETRTVQIRLDKYAVSFRDITAANGEKTGVWRAREGVYGVTVGSSSEHLHLQGEFKLEEGFTWEGL